MIESMEWKDIMLTWSFFRSNRADTEFRWPPSRESSGRAFRWALRERTWSGSRTDWWCAVWWGPWRSRAAPGMSRVRRVTVMIDTSIWVLLATKLRRFVHSDSCEGISVIGLQLMSMLKAGEVTAGRSAGTVVLSIGKWGRTERGTGSASSCVNPQSSHSTRDYTCQLSLSGDESSIGYLPPYLIDYFYLCPLPLTVNPIQVNESLPNEIPEVR